MLSATLIISAALLGLMALYLYGMLRATCALRRPVKANSWEDLPRESVAPFGSDSRWASELDEMSKLANEQARAIAGMAWLMNRVHTVDSPVMTGSPEQMLAAIESGKGALCGQMAYLLRHVLATLDLPSRTVYLQRNPFDCLDDHTLVEVLVEGRWVLLDPTFNLIFRGVDDRLLNAFEIKKLVFLGRNADVRPVFLGEVRYPPRSQAYYVGLLSLFCNVYVRISGSGGLSMFPPLRFFVGPRLYYVTVDGESDSSMRFWHHLYTLTVFLLPVGFMFVFAAALLVTVAGR